MEDLYFLKLLLIVFSFLIHIFYPLNHLRRGIQDFHMNYVLFPADEAADNVVVVVVVV